MAFIDRLIETLEKKKISQYKLCKELEIGQSTISSWKKGKMPTAEKIIAIVQYLEVSADWLLETNIDIENYTSEEKRLLDAYRSASPGIQEATRKLLDVPEQETRLSTYSIGKEAIWKNKIWTNWAKDYKIINTEEKYGLERIIHRGFRRFN